jgi:HAMP domain-containing protein
VDQQKFYIVVTIAAAVIALSFVIQAAVMIFILGAVRRLTALASQFQAKAEPILVKVGPVLEQVQGTVSNVKVTVDRISGQTKEAFDKLTLETRAIAAAVSVSSQEIVGLAKKQALQLSETLDLTNTTLQRQVTEIDALLLRTQNRIEDTTVEVQSTVLEPVRELSAMLVGLRRMIEALFGRDRKPIDRAYQDEEMFI